MTPKHMHNCDSVYLYIARTMLMEISLDDRTSSLPAQCFHVYSIVIVKEVIQVCR